MPKSTNQGTCFLCQQNVEHRVIKSHLKKCLEKVTINNTVEKTEKEKVFLLKIYAGKDFWLFVEINGSSTLEDLDYFLRKTWLECCGHMSQFKINNESYSCVDKMGKAIHRIMPVGVEFNYEYDFGDTTELQGTVISSRQGKLSEGIRLLSRNNMPDFVQCSTCKKTPIVICTDCYDFCCKTCKKDHDNCSGEDYMLPVVNSPRMGVCGYAGPED